MVIVLGRVDPDSCRFAILVDGRGVRLGRPSTLADRREEILQLKAQGVGLRKTARRLGMPASSVAKVLEEAQASLASPSAEE